MPDRCDIPELALAERRDIRQFHQLVEDFRSVSMGFQDINTVIDALYGNRAERLLEERQLVFLGQAVHFLIQTQGRAFLGDPGDLVALASHADTGVLKDVFLQNLRRHDSNSQEAFLADLPHDHLFIRKRNRLRDNDNNALAVVNLAVRADSPPFDHAPKMSGLYITRQRPDYDIGLSFSLFHLRYNSS